MTPVSDEKKPEKILNRRANTIVTPDDKTNVDEIYPSKSFSWSNLALINVDPRFRVAKIISVFSHEL